MHKRTCERKNCFANCGGRCAALISPKVKNCNFFKSSEQMKEERKNAYNRLYSMRRFDLISRYKSEKYGRQ